MFTLESFCIEMFHPLHLTLLLCQSRLDLLTSRLYPKQLKLRKVSFYMIRFWRRLIFKCLYYFIVFLLFLLSLFVTMLGEPVFGIGHAVFNEEYDLLPSATSGIVSKVHRMRNKVVMVQVQVVLLILRTLKVNFNCKLISIIYWCMYRIFFNHSGFPVLWQSLLLITFLISTDALIFTVQFQTTCAIHAGASGGPIVNRQGGIVGVTVCNAK